MENYQVEQKINVYLDAGGIPPEVYIKQYDHNLRVIAAQVWDGAQPYALPAGYVARVGVRKSDGKRVLNDCETSADGPTLTVYAVITQQMTAVAGKQRAEIQISGPEGQLRSGSWVLDVVPAEVGDDAIESTDEYKSIDAILAEVRQLKAAADKDAQEAVQSAAAAKASETAAAESQSAAADSASAAAASETAAQASAGAAAAIATAAADSAAAAKASETAAAQSAADAADAAERADGIHEINGKTGRVVDLTPADIKAVAAQGGEIGQTIVTYAGTDTAAPAPGDSMENIMRKMTAMYDRMVAAEAALPPIGDWTLAAYRITYAGGDVNASTYPWVNFDDDLLPAKYPKLYALYGATLSVGAPSGYFNLKKLADRFPLVSSSNFGGVGGAAEHALTVNQMPRHAHAIAYKNAQTGNLDTAYVNPATGASIGSANGAIQAVGAGEPHNNMPPYIRAVAHIRAG